jgi:hypothetical protein
MFDDRRIRIQSWIWIQEAQKHTDLDPQHFFFGLFFSEASNIIKILFFWKKEDLNKFLDPESRHRLIIVFFDIKSFLIHQK